MFVKYDYVYHLIQTHNNNSYRSTSVDLNFGDGGCAATYTYSHSRGLYAGASMEGSIIVSRSDVNHKFYGRLVTPLELLRGEVPPPRAARPLYDALQEATTAMSMPIYGNPPLTRLSPPPLSLSSAGTGKSGTYGTQGSTDSNGLANTSYDSVHNSHNAVTSSQRFRTISNPYIVQGTS